MSLRKFYRSFTKRRVNPNSPSNNSVQTNTTRRLFHRLFSKKVQPQSLMIVEERSPKDGRRPSSAQLLVAQDSGLRSPTRVDVPMVHLPNNNNNNNNRYKKNVSSRKNKGIAPTNNSVLRRASPLPENSRTPYLIMIVDDMVLNTKLLEKTLLGLNDNPPKKLENVDVQVVIAYNCVDAIQHPTINDVKMMLLDFDLGDACLLYTSPSPRDS